jgi:glycogen debranching enzyme
MPRRPHHGATEPSDDRYFIRATAAPADDHTRVTKSGETFAVVDRHGDILAPLEIGRFGTGEQGLYHEGTRFLSRLTLHINRQRPLLLSSTVIDSNDLLVVDFTNPDLLSENGENTVTVPHGVLHLFRSRFLWRGVAYERMRLSNHGITPVRFRLQYQYQADYADIFEVRGLVRTQRGTLRPAEIEADTVVLGYLGRDQCVRRTRLQWAPVPARLDETTAEFEISLEPGEQTELSLTVACEVDNQLPHIAFHDRAYEENERALQSRHERIARVHTSNEQFNAWVSRSVSDMLMLITTTPQGPYPYAGVPWYSTVFGRDGIITALQWLWAYPELARGVLLHLADRQATESDRERDAQPGKILHEARSGEMAALGEIPFGAYYGTVDATPLFVMLAGAYLRRTADRSLVERVWPAVERALDWIELYGDADGDGFVEYERMQETGLSNQGWKDSWDSVFHADGTLAETPIALCEVQGYVYAAWRAGSLLATAMGHMDLAAVYQVRAERLRERFDAAFWCDDLGLYALALDRAKRPCRVRASNAGHCLYTGIAYPARAARIAEVLLSEPFFCGWGVRTLAAGEPRYNPMSYHNGSVWPHDNGLIMAGLARYGFRAEVGRIATALFEATMFVELHRLPELFCGFQRRAGEGPTLYPVACSPQAWATGVPITIIEVLLGLDVDAQQRQLRLAEPVLTGFLESVDIDNLCMGGSRTGLRIERHNDDVSVRVAGRGAPLNESERELEVVIVK